MTDLTTFFRCLPGKKFVKKGHLGHSLVTPPPTDWPEPEPDLEPKVG